jgi:signal transduction histidine kinase
MVSSSSGTAAGLSRRYSAALEKQLALKPGASLLPAESLGREALSAGLDTLDLAAIHEKALIALPASLPSSGNHGGTARRAAVFFVAAITPLISARRAARKREIRADRANATLRRRLEHEIGRREAAQGALAASKEHYGRLLKKSRLAREHLRRLSHQILSTQEEERKAISRELHDEIGQTLTAINVKLATLKKEASVNTADLKKKIASTQRLVEKSMSTVHRFARELRPPLVDDLGLIPALHAYMKVFTKQAHVLVDFRAFAAVERLDGDKRMVLYRVAQEALANVAKHADAGRVDVRIRRVPGAVCMDIHDDGKSFEVERLHFSPRIKRLGLIGMRERVEMVGGRFTIESTPGKGTTIAAQIPFGTGRMGSASARTESVG